MVDKRQKTAAKVVDNTTDAGGGTHHRPSVHEGGGAHQKTVGLTPSLLATDD